MLKGEQLEGLRGLIDSVQGKEESTNATSRERMKQFLYLGIAHGLNERQKEVIKLLYVDGLTQKRVGELLNIKQPAVSNIKQRAIKKLRDLSRYASF